MASICSRTWALRQEDFTPEDVENYARSTCGEPLTPRPMTSLLAPDRRRRMMFEKFAPPGIVVLAVIRTGLSPPTRRPLRFSTMVDEPFVNTDFVAKVRFGNSGRGKPTCWKVPGHGTRSGICLTALIPVLERFVTDLVDGPRTCCAAFSIFRHAEVPQLTLIAK